LTFLLQGPAAFKFHQSFHWCCITHSS